MRKRMIGLIAVLLCLALLSGCGCEHEWKDATCTDPMTCALCEETEGAPNGHSWMAATCDAPKTCEICGAVEGEAKGHAWIAATCETAKTCDICRETEGEAQGHTWEDATTELPKTCSTCQETEGEKLNIDPKFTTASTKDLYGKWSCDVSLTGEDLGLEDYVDTWKCTLFYEFTNEGVVMTSVEFDDLFALIDTMKKVTIDALYAEFASMGLGQNAANEAMKEETGMTVEEFVNETYDSVDTDDLFELFEDFIVEGVYYVEGDALYMGFDGWEGEFESSDYTIEGDLLIIEEDTLGEEEEPLQWTRVKE